MKVYKQYKINNTSNNLTITQNDVCDYFLQGQLWFKDLNHWGIGHNKLKFTNVQLTTELPLSDFKLKVVLSNEFGTARLEGDIELVGNKKSNGTYNLDCNIFNIIPFVKDEPFITEKYKYKYFEFFIYSLDKDFSLYMEYEPVHMSNDELDSLSKQFDSQKIPL